uniref:Uncharacterized protein n=1 Tax=Molossus molossus TaxID=27622 RepID=A0A7J8JWR4_MOLMO|nr:hypothetical protein HJG59_007937 [Molossus molossus]
MKEFRYYYEETEDIFQRREEKERERGIGRVGEVETSYCWLSLGIVGLLGTFTFFFFIDFRERGRERERQIETSMRENIDWPPPACPPLGLGPQPGHMPLWGTKPTTSWCMGHCSTTEPHQPGRNLYFCLNTILLE